MTPDDAAQLAALRATLPVRGSLPKGAGADRAPHWSDMIEPAYTPEVAALYDSDPTDAAIDPAAESDLTAIDDDTDDDLEDDTS